MLEHVRPLLDQSMKMLCNHTCNDHYKVCTNIMPIFFQCIFHTDFHISLPQIKNSIFAKINIHFSQLISFIYTEHKDHQ